MLNFCLENAKTAISHNISLNCIVYDTLYYSALDGSSPLIQPGTDRSTLLLCHHRAAEERGRFTPDKIALSPPNGPRFLSKKNICLPAKNDPCGKLARRCRQREKFGQVPRGGKKKPQRVGEAVPRLRSFVFFSKRKKELEQTSDSSQTFSQQ